RGGAVVCFRPPATPADTVTETALVGGFTRSGVGSPTPAAAPFPLGATTPSDRPLSMPSKPRLETSVDWGTAGLSNRNRERRPIRNQHLFATACSLGCGGRGGLDGGGQYGGREHAGRGRKGLSERHE